MQVIDVDHQGTAQGELFERAGERPLRLVGRSRLAAESEEGEQQVDCGCVVTSPGQQVEQCVTGHLCGLCAVEIGGGAEHLHDGPVGDALAV